jgi:pimeloyl-ACP methyl ester carboxylesterase
LPYDASVRDPNQEETMSIPSLTTEQTQFVTSADGTPIAYEVTGSGPPLILVDGGLCQRSLGPSRGLAKALAGGFRVYRYDRRGRGDSGAGPSPYAMTREIEDLRGMLEAAGGSAHVLGVSSGAVLALEAARQGAPIDRLVVYEAPFIVDSSHPANDSGLPRRLQNLVDDGRRPDAVTLFLQTVGAPAAFIAMMRLTPAWKRMTGVAHTLPYDLAIVIDHQQGRPIATGYYRDVTCETLVLAGARSPEYMRNAQAAIAGAVPHARYETLAKQTHQVKPTAVAPIVTTFLHQP